jgi:hypothetical protein
VSFSSFLKPFREVNAFMELKVFWVQIISSHLAFLHRRKGLMQAEASGDYDHPQKYSQNKSAHRFPPRPDRLWRSP